MPISKLPGLIDVHVHLREPGATQKEDFDTGTAAAVRGGYGFVIDMPNNPGAPTVSIERLEEKIELSKKAHCGIGFHYGTDGKNMETFALASANPHVYGLKIYCNHTTGDLLIEDRAKLEEIFRAWESDKPIMVHAEGPQLEMALELAQKHKRRLHECHISLASEVALLAQAKQSLMHVSAGVTPHHLFLTKEQSAAIMKPPLATQADQDALWQGIKDEVIDLVETDHAPHTPEEKAKGAFGVTGLETALGLMGLAIHEGKITEHDVIKLMHLNPKTIFNITTDTGTIAVDFDKAYTVDSSQFASKAKHSPFDGWTLYGTILRPN